MEEVAGTMSVFLRDKAQLVIDRDNGGMRKENEH
jgi:hypothetical protein